LFYFEALTPTSQRFFTAMGREQLMAKAKALQTERLIKMHALFCFWRYLILGIHLMDRREYFVMPCEVHALAVF
jgi:hypothetical protein